VAADDAAGDGAPLPVHRLRACVAAGHQQGGRAEGALVASCAAVGDPNRLDGVAVIGVDEHCWRHTRRGEKYVTVIIDLTPVRDGAGPARLLDMVDGRSKMVFKTWLDRQSTTFRAGIEVVAMDGFTGFKTAAAETVPDAVAVMDPFHVVALAGGALERCRQRVQQQTRGHRGRTGDPLYGIRRVLRRRADHLSAKARARLEAGLVAGDPDGEVTIAWVIAQRVMALYRLADPAEARAQVAELIAALRGCPVAELARLGRTLHAWHVELVAHFDHPDVSNGPTENLNLKIKNTKRIARGYRNFDHYRLRLLLNHGRIRKDQSPTRIRTRAPRFVA